MPPKLWQAFDHPHNKDIFPDVPTEPPLQQAQLSAIIHSQEQSAVLLSVPSGLHNFRKLWRAVRSFSLLFAWLDNPHVLSFSSQDMPTKLFTSFVALMNSFKDLNTLFVLWSTELHTIFQVKLHQHKIQLESHLLWLFWVQCILQYGGQFVQKDAVRNTVKGLTEI